MPPPGSPICGLVIGLWLGPSRRRLAVKVLFGCPEGKEGRMNGDDILWFIYFISSTSKWSTPLKFNMESKNHLIGKDNHLPDLQFHFDFPGAMYRITLFSERPVSGILYRLVLLTCSVGKIMV